MPTFPPLPTSQNELSAVLSTFLAQHATTTSFISPSTPVEQKQTFVEELIKGVESGTWEDEVVTKALQVLRILTRESEGMGRLISESGISLLMKHANLPTDNTDNIPSYKETPHASEALKCLCNALLQYPPARQILRNHSGTRIIGTLLKEQHQTLSLDTQFLLLRLTFLLTVDHSATVHELMDQYDFPAILAKLLASLVPKATQGPAEIMVINEILKTVYNMMNVAVVKENQGMGSDSVLTMTGEKKVDGGHAEPFKDLLPPIITILTTYSLPDPPLSPPISHALHTLLNYPIQPYRSLFFPNSSYTIIDRLLTMLDRTLTVALGDTDGDPDKHSATPRVGNIPLDDTLPPLILVLEAMAKADEATKKVIKGRIMPDDIDRSKPLDKGTSTTARLIGFLHAITLPNIRQTVSDLFFVLCDEDAEKLVTYLGYGHTAGYLHQRGLVPSLPASSSSSTSNTPHINPITGEYDKQSAEDEWNKLTDEEKEREAEKLFVLFERLNRTGVISVRPQMGGQ